MKYSAKELESNNAYRSVPKSIRKTIYDSDDNVLFGSHMTKGKVYYEYIPAELMEENVDFIICSGCIYDGKGNIDLDPGVEILSRTELKKRFILNNFQG